MTDAAATLHPIERGFLADLDTEAVPDPAVRLIYADWLAEWGREDEGDFQRTLVDAEKEYGHRWEAYLSSGLSGEAFDLWPDKECSFDWYHAVWARNDEVVAALPDELFDLLPLEHLESREEDDERDAPVRFREYRTRREADAALYAAWLQWTGRRPT